MADGEIYAHIDNLEGGGGVGNRVKLNSNGTWKFAEGGENDSSFDEWYRKTGNSLAIGIISSIIAGLIIYFLIKSKN